MSQANPRWNRELHSLGALRGTGGDYGFGSRWRLGAGNTGPGVNEESDLNIGSVGFVFGAYL